MEVLLIFPSGSSLFRYEVNMHFLFVFFFTIKVTNLFVASMDN